MVTATAFGRLPVKSDTGPQITLGDAAAEPDPPSKRRNTAPRHRHSPVRGKAGQVVRVPGNCGCPRKLRAIFGIAPNGASVCSQPGVGSVFSASPHIPELM